MFKLSKKADYGLIAMKHLANHREQHACSANEIAEEYGISATLMAKVLQKLAKSSLVAAKHGSTGGYQLAKEAARISALEVITAIDGPVLITSCVTSARRMRRNRPLFGERAVAARERKHYEKF